MGNIIGVYLDSKRSSLASQPTASDVINALNGTGSNEPLTGEPGEVQHRRSNAEGDISGSAASASSATATGQEADPDSNMPTTNFTPFDVTVIKQYTSELLLALAKFESSTTTEIISKIESNIISLFNQIASISITLIKSTLTILKSTLSTPIDSTNPFKSLPAAIEEFISICNSQEYDPTSVINQINENFVNATSTASQQLEDMKVSVKTINDRWHNTFDKNETIAQIDTFTNENPDLVVGFDFTQLDAIRDEISSILDEGDAELKALQLLSISPTIDASSALEILSSAFTDLYDLYDDDSRLSLLSTSLQQVYKNIQTFADDTRTINTNKSNIDTVVKSFSDARLDISTKSAFVTSNLEEDATRFELLSTMPSQIATFKAEAALEETKEINPNLTPEAVAKLETTLNELNQSYTELKSISVPFQTLSNYLDTYETKALSLQSNYTDSLKSEWISSYNTIDITKFNEIQSTIQTQYDKFVSADTACDTKYQEFMNLHSSITQDLTLFFDTLVKKNSRTMEEFEATLEVKRQTLKLNYSNIIESASEVRSSTINTIYISDLKTDLEDSIKNINLYYKSTFIDPNNYESRYQDQKSIYISTISKLQDTSLAIASLNSAFISVSDAMNKINDQLSKSNQTYQDTLGLITTISEAQSKESERIAKAEREKEYNNKFNEYAGIISIKTSTLEEAISLKATVTKEINDFSGHLDESIGSSGSSGSKLDEISLKISSDDENEFAQQALSAASSAREKKSSFDSLAASILSSVNLLYDNANLSASTLKEITTNASDPDVDKRPSISEVKSNIEAIDTDTISKTKDKINSDRSTLASLYIETTALVSTAFDFAAIVDPSFNDYKQSTIESYVATLEAFDKALSSYQENSESIMNTIIDNAKIMNCRYIELYNAVIATPDNMKPNEYTYNKNGEALTVSCSDILITLNSLNSSDSEQASVEASSLSTLYHSCMEQWSSISNYASQEQTDKFASIVTNIKNKITSLSESCDESNKYIDSYYTSVKSIIDSQVNNFKENVATLKNMISSTSDASLSKAEETRSIALAAYKSCNDTFNNDVAKKFQTIKEQAESSYLTAAETIHTDLVENVKNLTINVIDRKRDLIRYRYAARILAYLFGHYYIGRYKPEDNWTISYTSGSETNIRNLPWKDWLQWEISTCLIPDEYNKSNLDEIEQLRKLDVFKTLCLYTPILPLIWPYGSTSTERNFQTGDNALIAANTDAILNGAEFLKVKGLQLIQYISKDLVDIICKAIIGTMNKTQDSSLEKFVDEEVCRRIIEKARSIEGGSTAPVITIQDDDGEVHEYQLLSFNEMLKKDTKYQEYTTKIKELRTESDQYYEIMLSNKTAGEMPDELFESFKDDSDMVKSRSAYKDAEKKYNDLVTEAVSYESQAGEIYSRIEKEFQLIQEKYQTSEEVNSYWQQFFDEAAACAIPPGEGETYDERSVLNDRLFARVCVKYLENGTSNIHNYWKLLVTVSGKTRGITQQPLYIPTAFPIYNKTAEIKEAIIIVINRIISKLGYPSYSLVSNPDKASEPVEYETYLNNKDLDAEIVNGGQCMAYTDYDAYNLRMHRKLKEGTESEYEINDNYLFSFDKLCNGKFVNRCIRDNNGTYDLFGYRKCTEQYEYMLSGRSSGYLGYVNPTGMFNYLFNAGPADLPPLDCISISNFCSSSNNEKDECSLGIEQTVRSLYEQIQDMEEIRTKNQTGLALSTDYLVDDPKSKSGKSGDLIAAKVFELLVSNALNWKVVFPYMSQSSYSGSGYIPINKINNVMYNHRGRDGKIIGHTLYEIFNRK